MRAQALFQSMRLPFLLLVPVCVLLGAATVERWPAWPLGLALLGGLLAHISVNTLNEYLDFKSGLDLRTRRTPFSGGSGALPRRPEMARPVLLLGLLALAGVVAIGLHFVWRLGPGILPVGLLGAALIVLYTGWINRHPWLCLIAPGLGFGLLMVMGTQFVLAGRYDPAALWAAAVPFFLVNNLLLLNQYPDIGADRHAGRNHLPIAYGVPLANRVYGLFLLAPAALILFAVATGRLPAWGLAALLPLGLGVHALRGARRHGGTIGEHPHYLAANVAATLLTPLVLGLALLFG